MYKIALTGGPGSGKSTCLSKLERSLSERGYKVFIVPETATELIPNGIYPSDVLPLLDFQRIVLEKQIHKEKIYDEIANFWPSEDVIILYDRTVLDGMVFVKEDEFKNLLKNQNLTLLSALERYDMVIHLITAAEEAPEFYLWNNPESEEEGNNAARSEPPELAIERDHKSRKIFVKHPHFRIINSSKSFDDKVNKLIEEVHNFIGAPVPSEIERKFLIKKPSEKQLKELKYSSHTNIIQTYLKAENKTERRIRQRGNNKDGFTFYYTEKTDIAPGERLEVERRISEKEYINYLSEADINLHQIAKTRYCFLHKKKFFELDIYPFSDEYAILEIELKNIKDEFSMPSFVEVIKEVTDDENFKNINLAKTLSFHTN